MIPTSEWVIQLVMPQRADERNRQQRYLPWAGYTLPMTGDQAMCALRECEMHWPAYEFRGHTLNGDETQFVLPVQSADWTDPARL